MGVPNALSHNAIRDRGIDAAYTTKVRPITGFLRVVIPGAISVTTRDVGMLVARRITAIGGTHPA